MMVDKTDMNIDKYKKLIMTQYKIDMNITKYKELNMTEHKAYMNITKIHKYKKKPEQQFYEREQNRCKHY